MLLCAHWVWTPYLFCEAEAEETPVLNMVDKKPKADVKTENLNHINLKVVEHHHLNGGGPVVWFKIQRDTLKESYRAQNSLELKLPSGSSPPFYAKQRTLSPEEKMDLKVDYA